MKTTAELSVAKKAYSRIGLSLSISILAAFVLQLAWFQVPVIFLGEDNALVSADWWYWLGVIVPMYMIAMPLCVLLLRKLPVQPAEPVKLTGKAFGVFFLITCAVMYLGNLLGQFIMGIVSDPLSGNQVLDAIGADHPLKYLVFLVCAPLMEEWLFRKQIIDRTRQYGEKTAVLLSGLAFGLFHQNLTQFFYAFGLGVLFAYVYLRTGRLQYTILLHGIVNFMGGVIAPLLLQTLEPALMGDPNAMTEADLIALIPGLLVLYAYVFALIGLVAVGISKFVKYRKQFLWREAPEQLPKGSVGKTVFGNVGMILLLVISLLMIGLVT